MSLNSFQNKLSNIFKVILFLGVVVIIVLLFPNRDSMKYQFEVGKPWSYDLLMASYDFPIYKSEVQIQQEKKEILKKYLPFYNLDTTVFTSQYQMLINNYKEEHGENPPHLNDIHDRLKNIYEKGILSAEQHQKLKENNTVRINCILPDKLTHTVELEEIYTPKTAYEKLMQAEAFQSGEYNFNLYLTENLHYDSIFSNLSQKELFKNLSLTAGVIQAGERIIDRGEIVNEELFLILQSMKIEYDQRRAAFQRSKLVLIGEIIVITGLIVIFYLFLYLFKPRIFNNLKNLIFINLMIIIMIALSSVVIQLTTVSYFIIPFALLPIIIRVFFDPRTALFAHIITVSIASLMVDNPYQFLLIQIIVGMAAVSSLKDMTQRSQLVQSALIIFITYSLMYLALEFISEGVFNKIYWTPLIYFAISSAFLLFAYLLIYIFEKIFGLISSITLLELTNINSDLMMQFAEKAPGTFQHTLQVSNLATEAAKKIGANSLLVRTGALYHDIGKMENPGLFIENQYGGQNPLDELEFSEAAQKIIKHVTDGVKIAKKEHLPEQIIHFITTHHGRSKAKYFYNAFINANPGVKPDPSLFSYPGPLPDTQETAILMMADAVEARARSLNEYNEKSITDCVEEMIDAQIAEGQFKKAPLSFRDVETIKSVFKEKIMSMYHTRIVYPEIKRESERES
jgi:putative nucleotidyltransferase with HDIG domain